MVYDWKWGINEIAKRSGVLNLIGHLEVEEQPEIGGEWTRNLGKKKGIKKTIYIKNKLFYEQSRYGISILITDNQVFRWGERQK